MKLYQRARFNALLTEFTANAKEELERLGYINADELSQIAALDLCEKAAVNSAISEREEFGPEAIKSLDLACNSRAASRHDEPEFETPTLWHARNVKDSSSPYHFLIAKEIIDNAQRLGLEAMMMGDTMQEEASYFGVSRQRVHQMAEESRELMSEYLIL